MMIDLLLLALIAVSALLGLLRGFLASISGLLSWLLAGWAGLRFGKQAAYWLAKGAEPSLSQLGGGYVAVFLAALLLALLVSMALRSVIHSTVLLKTPDRALGLGFGVIRGVVLAAVALVLLRFTPLAEQEPWQDSQAVAWLAPVSLPSLAQMPLPDIPSMDLHRFQPTAPANPTQNALDQATMAQRLDALKAATTAHAVPPEL